MDDYIPYRVCCPALSPSVYNIFSKSHLLVPRLRWLSSRRAEPVFATATSDGPCGERHPMTKSGKRLCKIRPLYSLEFRTWLHIERLLCSPARVLAGRSAAWVTESAESLRPRQLAPSQRIPSF